MKDFHTKRQSHKHRNMSRSCSSGRATFFW